MRIGLVTDTYLPDINGVVSSTVTLKNALEREGHEVFVITNHAAAHIEMDGSILRLPGIKLKSLYGYKMSSPINVGATDIIRDMNLDVLHLQTNFGIGLYGAHLARVLGLPLVDTYHTMYEDYTHYINPFNSNGIEKFSREAIRAVSRKVCNSVQAVIAPSEKTKETLIDYGVIAPIYVVPTGLNLEQFNHAHDNPERLQAIRQQVTDDPEAFVLVFIGRLAKEKSLEMLIDAAAQNPDPHFHLAVVGAGPDEEYYQNYTKSKGAADKVHFLGKAAPEDIAYYYAAFDAFASASLSETQGMTYLEALACGLMVFGRRDEVLQDLIEEGRTGYYFDTPDELLKKLKEFQKLSADQRQETAEICRKKTAPFTDTAFAFKMSTVYSQAIEDYSKTFVVEKVKLQDDFAFLELSRDASSQNIKVMMPLDDYFYLKISPQSKLDAYLVSSYLDQMDFYYSVFRTRYMLAKKDMTKAQVIRYCTQRLNADPAMAKAAADELEERGLINDRKYAQDKASYYQSGGYGKKQIAAKLYKAGVERSVIDEVLETLPEEEEYLNARAAAARLAKTLKTQSITRRKQTIMSRLISRGFSPESAREAAEELHFEQGEEEEALEKAWMKARRLYASKPEAEKHQKIATYLLRQGFQRSLVNELMESEEDLCDLGSE